MNKHKKSRLLLPIKNFTSNVWHSFWPQTKKTQKTNEMSGFMDGENGQKNTKIASHRNSMWF